MARILCIHTDSLRSMQLGLALQAQGHTIQLTGDPSHAIRIAVAFRPNVIFADAGTHGRITTLEAISALRSIQPDTRAVVTDANTDPKTTAAIDRLGVSAVLQKPLTSDTAVSAVDSVLGAQPRPAPLSLGVFEYSAGHIRYSNRYGTELLQLSKYADASPSMHDVFEYRSLVELDSCCDTWIKLKCRGEQAAELTGIHLSLEEERELVIFVRSEHERLREHPTVELLVSHLTESATAEPTT